MNCFEARNDFVAFWQKSLSDGRRAQLLMHLRGCAACDRSFRNFALTAPVLYSAKEPEWAAQPVDPVFMGAQHLAAPGRSLVVHESRPAISYLNRVLPALVTAAAAVIALYLAVPPRITFEDAIAADNSSTEVATYPATDSILGQELVAQSTPAPDYSDE
jgi:predicted anti-sigma-YlaC factor YlaD